MKDLELIDNRVQIFCTFVVGFETMRTTVKDMASSKEESEQARAVKICEIIESFVGEDKKLEGLLDRLRVKVAGDKVKALLQYVKVQLKTKDDTFVEKLYENSELLKREVKNHINTKQRVAIEGLDDESLITADARVPVTESDLIFLNDIAAMSVKEGEFISDYSKYFNTASYKNRICQLYHSVPYYFEQAFANIDVRLQNIVLEIIEYDANRDKKNMEKQDCLKSLKDLNVLCNIDTSANKMTSKVTDHQAFEMFLSILERNNNDNLINKILRDDIIMKTLFEVSTSSSGSNYGFRRLFTAAHYPYDQIIMKKFMQVKNYNTQSMQVIVTDLCRDAQFRESYDRYKKAEKTKGFKIVMESTMEAMATSEINDELVDSVMHILEEFTKLEEYSDDILQMHEVYNVIEKIYTQIIQHDLFDEFPGLIAKLQEFYNYRVKHDHYEKRSKFAITQQIAIYGITPQDVWYDIHKILRDCKYNDFDKVFLKYGAAKVFDFDIKKNLQDYGKQLTSGDIKALPSNQLALICADVDAKGFDIYVYGIFNRLFRAMVSKSLHTQVKRIEQGTFKKTEYPGLSTSDESNVRKAITDYLTLSTLVAKDPDLFVTLYWRKVADMLDALVNVKASYDSIKSFAKLDIDSNVLQIFDNKNSAMRLNNEYDRLKGNAKKVQMDRHMEEFMNLPTAKEDVPDSN